MTRQRHARGSAELIVGVEDLNRRIIEPDDFVADTSAFVDVRLDGSEGKASYSFIGPGVSQNADQVVNLAEPHGFNIGAASMPHGVVNSQHLHYTAEVFICTRGQWQMRLGQHGDQRVDIGPNTVFSIPTWIFRGFQNIGGDDSWFFTVLGGDDTGGILWAPQVLEAAAATGLYLTPHHAVVDASAGHPIDDTLPPIDESRLGELDSYTDGEIRERIVGPDQLEWSSSALLSAVLPGHGSAMAPVIGFGLTEDRRHRPPIWTPHGFTLEWLRLDPGASTGLHRIEQAQALFLVEGEWQISYNRGDDRVSRTTAEGAVVSVPAGCWREFSNTGVSTATCLVVCDGDERARAEWDAALVAAVSDLGWANDASGYRAPVDLLARTPS
jgi:mannose-6-phosphate isomerase-like protein (cupin superfamily)